MKGMIFSSEMVNAIMEGRKRMDRRVVKTRSYICDVVDGVPHEMTEDGDRPIRCPYKIGEIVYVKETWVPAWTGAKMMGSGDYVYKAGIEGTGLSCDHWNSPMFMPERAARLFLRITDRSLERLQEISEADAIAEGIRSFRPVPGDGAAQTMYYHYLKDKWGPSPRHSYETLWKSIHGKRHPWESNPWVWVFSFEVVKGGRNG